MTPIKRKLLYIFRDTLLRLRITWNHGTSLTVSVGYHVNKTDSRGRSSWDGSRCRKNTSHGADKVPASVINRELEILEERISKAFFYFENLDKIPTKEELKEKIKPEGAAKGKTISELANQYIQEQSILSQWTFGMIRTVKRSLESMIAALGPNITLDEIDDTKYATLLKSYFSRPLVTLKEDDTPKVTHGLQNSTINGYLNNIRRFARWAKERGYCSECRITNQPASLKTIKKPVIFLELEELYKIQSLDLQYFENLTKARDMFFFCCFTGLRFSDMQALKWGDVSEDSIEIVTKKTSDRLVIELNQFSKGIIDSPSVIDHNNSDNVFQKMSLKHFNNLLTELGKMAELNEEIEIANFSGTEKIVQKFKKYECITSHTARKTFVCNALSLGIPPNIVMKWTGHKNYKSMNPYINITSKAKKENMNLFDNLPPMKSSKKFR